MFVKCLFVCSTDKCDCDSYFLTTTKTEHSRILKYEMGIFSEIVRLIYSSVYFFKVTHFNRDITLYSKILTWSRACPFEVTVHQILRK